MSTVTQATFQLRKASNDQWKYVICVDKTIVYESKPHTPWQLMAIFRNIKYMKEEKEFLFPGFRVYRMKKNAIFVCIDHFGLTILDRNSLISILKKLCNMNPSHPQVRPIRPEMKAMLQSLVDLHFTE